MTALSLLDRLGTDQSLRYRFRYTPTSPNSATGACRFLDRAVMQAD
jgi:hypothetical protein